MLDPTMSRTSLSSCDGRDTWSYFICEMCIKEDKWAQSRLKIEEREFAACWVDSVQWIKPTSFKIDPNHTQETSGRLNFFKCFLINHRLMGIHLPYLLVFITRHPSKGSLWRNLESPPTPGPLPVTANQRNSPLLSVPWWQTDKTG